MNVLEGLFNNKGEVDNLWLIRIHHLNSSRGSKDMVIKEEVLIQEIIRNIIRCTEDIPDRNQELQLNHNKKTKILKPLTCNPTSMPTH